MIGTDYKSEWVCVTSLWLSMVCCKESGFTYCFLYWMQSESWFVNNKKIIQGCLLQGWVKVMKKNICFNSVQSRIILANILCFVKIKKEKWMFQNEVKSISIFANKEELQYLISEQKN